MSLKYTSFKLLISFVIISLTHVTSHGKRMKRATAFSSSHVYTGGLGSSSGGNRYGANYSRGRIIKDPPGHIPQPCSEHIYWAFNSGRGHLNANEMYPNMKYIVGMDPKHATYEDFQRIFKCQNIHSNLCNDNGLQFPVTCSVPPCNRCTAQRIDFHNNMSDISGGSSDGNLGTTSGGSKKGGNYLKGREKRSPIQANTSGSSSSGNTGTSSGGNSQGSNIPKRRSG